MANFYTDNSELKYHLNHPLMEKIVRLKERDFSFKDNFEFAPLDYEDAMDNYERVLEIVGEVCGDIIGQNAVSIDAEGPQVVDGRVIYAAGTTVNLQALNQAGLMGMSLPYKYDGLNFPIVPYIMAADIVSRADAGFVNIWGLQDCAETINEFASEDRRKNICPAYVRGKPWRWTLLNRMQVPICRLYN